MNAKMKVYLTDSEFPDYIYEKLEIEKVGGSIERLSCKTEEDIIKYCQDAVGLIVQYAPITKHVLESLPNLKVVSRMGIGVDNIDIEAATKLGIYVSNVPDGSLEEVSSHALALLMALSRKITVLNNTVKVDKNWNMQPAIPIRRFTIQTLGFLSFGRIAQRLAEKAKPLGLKMIAYDPYLPENIAKQYDVKLVDIETVLEQSDYISIHSPLTKETRHLINIEALKKMKNTAYLINTGRGPIIDEKALIEALKTKEIAGAGLDVLETEPIENDNPLLEMENVIITPHVAWYSDEALIDIRSKVAKGVAEVISGTIPKYLVNKNVKAKI